MMIKKDAMMYEKKLSTGCDVVETRRGCRVMKWEDPPSKRQTTTVARMRSR